MIEVKSIGGKNRLFDTNTGSVATSTRNGKPIDGGGHKDVGKAQRQAAYLNQWIERQGKGQKF